MQLPGNDTHQQILQLFVNLFQKDKNILAFIVFGSLVKGDWDNYSDIDLDAVVTSDNKDIVQNEIQQMHNTLTSSGYKVISSFEEYPNEQVIILDTLDRVSIRFHTLNDTHPAILESMKVLCGKLSESDIKKSAIKEKKKADIKLLNNKFLEHAIYVPVSINRNKLMNAMFFLNKMRQTLIQIFIITHHLEREFDFEQHASPSIKEALQQTYPEYDKDEIEKALAKLIDIYKSNIKEISSGHIKLTQNQLLLLKKVKTY